METNGVLLFTKEDDSSDLRPKDRYFLRCFLPNDDMTFFESPFWNQSLH